MQEVVNVFEVFENSEFGKIRTVVKDGEIWFVAKDVCDILGYAETYDMTRWLEEDEKETTKDFDPEEIGVSKKVRMITLINESGLYNAVFNSKKKEAKEFKKWVTSDVLPTIRKTGGYVSNTKMFVNTYFSSMKDEDKQFLIQTLDSKLEAEKKLKKAEERIEKQTVYIDNLTSDLDVVLIRKICTDFVNNTAKDSGKAHKDIWNTLYGFLGRALKIDLKHQYDKYISEKLSLVQENRVFNLEHKLKGNDRKFPNTKKEVEISKLEYVCKILGAGSDLINCMAKTFEVDVAVILDRYTYEKS